MKFWYFNFEGRFRADAKFNAGMGLFSSCLIPASDRDRPKARLIRELRQNDIALVDIVESFLIDDETLDPSDEPNQFWIEWCRKCRASRRPSFDKWHVFEEGSAN